MRLCRLDATPAAVLQAFEEARSSTPSDDTVAWLFAQYFASDEFGDLADTTQQDYRQGSKMILAVMARAKFRAVQPEHVKRYVAGRARTTIYRANRELSLLKTVYGWACSEGLVRHSPADPVKPRKGEKRRRTRATAADYAAVLKRAPPAIQVAMEIAYCTGLRPADILALRWDQVTERGIVVRHQKTYDRTGKEWIKRWSPRLRAAIEAARALPKPANIASLYVVHNRRGQRYTGDGFSAVFRRLGAPFQFYDIKRAAVTDYKGATKAEFSGHESERMARSYDVDPIESPSH